LRSIDAAVNFPLAGNISGLEKHRTGNTNARFAPAAFILSHGISIPL